MTPAAALTQPAPAPLPAAGGPLRPALQLVAVAAAADRVVARWAATGADGQSVGFLAVVVDTPAGSCLVVAERHHGAAGAWQPARRLPATTEAVRLVARQHGHGTTTTAGDGGLFR